MLFNNKPAQVDFNTIPIGLEEFYQWCDDTIALTRLPINDSMRFALATIILEEKELLSKQQAARKLVKAAQNQLAAFVFQDVKAKRIAADQEAAQKKPEQKVADETGSESASQGVVPQA